MMKIFNVDSFVVKGNSHIRCEDYTTHFEKNAYQKGVVVCDGCSSAKNSDIGSMLLALLAKKVLTARGIDLVSLRYEGFISEVLEWLNLARSLVGVDEESLFSTLCVGYTYELENKHFFRAFIYGDGVIFARKKNTNEWRIWQINYASNAPFYPQYLQDKGASYEIFLLGQAHDPLKELIETTETHQSRYPFNSPIDICLNLEEYDLVGVASDGVESFTKGTSDTAIPAIDVIKELTAFKNKTGQFMARRVLKALKAYQNAGYVPYDDVSIGVIVVDELKDEAVN